MPKLLVLLALVRLLMLLKGEWTVSNLALVDVCFCWWLTQTEHLQVLLKNPIFSAFRYKFVGKMCPTNDKCPSSFPWRKKSHIEYSLSMPSMGKKCEAWEKHLFTLGMNRGSKRHLVRGLRNRITGKIKFESSSFFIRLFHAILPFPKWMHSDNFW